MWVQLLSEGERREERAACALPCERAVQYATRAGLSRELSQTIEDVSKPRDVTFRAECPVKRSLVEYDAPLLALSDLHVRPHPGRVHDKALDEPRRQVEQVVRGDRRVGQRDPLHARM